MAREQGDTATMNPLIDLRKGLRKHFGDGAAVFVDILLYQCGVIAVDILRLDAHLQRKHSDYADDESMSGFIARKYGEEAERFVKAWLKGVPRDGHTTG